MGNMVETAAQGRVARFRGDRCCCLRCSLKRDGSCSALCLFPDSFPQARILVALHDGICPMCINHVPSVFVLTTLPHYFFPCIHILFFSQLIEFSQYACPHVSVGWFGRFIFFIHYFHPLLSFYDFLHFGFPSHIPLSPIACTYLDYDRHPAPPCPYTCTGIGRACELVLKNLVGKQSRVAENRLHTSCRRHTSTAGQVGQV